MSTSIVCVLFLEPDGEFCGFISNVYVMSENVSVEIHTTIIILYLYVCTCMYVLVCMYICIQYV